MNIGRLATRNARRHPDKTAIVFENKRFSFKEFNDRVNRLSNALISLGLNKGDRVAILMDNCNQFFETYMATAKAQLVVVPLNRMYKGMELAYLFNDSEARAAVMGANYWELMQEITPELPYLQHRLVVAADHKATFADAHNYEALLDASDPAEIELETDERDICYILYSSGTTGYPKGVMVSHRNLWASLVNHVCCWGEPERDDTVALIVLPLVFSASYLIQFLPHTFMGDTIILHKGFEVQDMLETVQQEKVTITELVPTMLVRILNYPEFDRHDVSSLRTILYGSAPIPEVVLRRGLEVFGSVFIQLYGQSECVGITTWLPKKDHILDGPERVTKKLRSAGREVFNTEVRVVDEDGHDVKPGEVGEIIVRGDQVMMGYWKKPDASFETLRDGWCHSGDLATVDEDGYIYIVDRKKDMIISGGINIFPIEIEHVLYRHTAVLEAAVIGVPDDEWGESVKAVIVPRPGATLAEEEVIEFCKANLASYKKPRSVDFVDDLPRNPSGKVLKRVLRERYWQGRTRHVH